MKSNRSLFILLASALLTLSVTSLPAEDWTMPDGQVYHDVSVVKIEPDALTILHHDGGGLIPMTKLPPNLQARFHYDPVAAQAAAQAREQAEARAQAAAELVQAEQMAAQALAARNTNASDTGATESAAPTPSNTGGHYSMDTLAASAHSLRIDASDSTHYSMGNLAASAHSLKADSSDSNHHTMGELVNSGL